MSFKEKLDKRAGKTTLTCDSWKKPRVFISGSPELSQEKAALRQAGHVQIMPPAKAWRFGRISRK